MRVKLLLFVLFLTATVCGCSKDDSSLPKFLGIKKTYAPNERVFFNVVNNSPWKIWYWVAAMRREENGGFSEIGPLDIEAPQHMKTSVGKPLMAGETKTIAWPPSMAILGESSKGKYKFIIYYEKDITKLDHPQINYSSEFEVN